MTPRRPTRTAGILILSASFGGAARMVADSLHRYVRSRDGIVDVKLVDLFEETMPSLNVLARFAYQRDPSFFPSGVMTWPGFVDAFPASPVISEVERGGMARLEEMLDALRPAAVISCFPLGAVLATHASRDLPTTIASVACGFSVRDAAIHPETDLQFVATREARDELVVAGVPYDRIVVTGIPVQRTEAGAAESLPGTGGFRAVLDGSAPGASIARVAEVLVSAGARMVVTPCGDDRTRRALSGLVARGGVVREAPTAADVTGALLDASVTVVHGGSPLAVEAVAAGCPIIIYNEIPELELDSVDFLVNAGAALVARDEADAAEKARFLSAHPRRLAQLAECARELAKPMAAQSICERVLAGS